MKPRNRLLEANNPQSKAAYNEGLKWEEAGNLTKAYICYLQASKQGYDRAAFKLEKLSVKMGMEGSIDPAAHNRNLEETNRKPEAPQISRSWRLPREDKLLAVENLRPAEKKSSAVVQSKVRTSVNSESEQKNTTSDFGELKRKAKKGDKEAQYAVAGRYIRRACKYLEKASAQHHAESQQLLDKITRAEQPQPAAPAPTSTLRIWQAKRDLYSGQTVPESAIHREVNMAVPPATTSGSGQIYPEPGAILLSYTGGRKEKENIITLKELWKNICLYLRQKSARSTAKSART